MSLLLALLLDSWQVTAGQAAVDALHSYDVLAYEIDALPTDRGLEVDCRLTVKILRRGPLRFLLSRAVQGLAATLDDAGVEATLGDFGLGALIDAMGGAPGDLPLVLTLEPRGALEPGREATFRLRYTWRPRPGGWFRATARDVQTHLSGFWLPTMADELFLAKVRVHTDATAFAPGRGRRTDDGWLFESGPVQTIPLVVADLARVEGKGCEVFLPATMGAEGERMARDLADVLKKLETWFGRIDEGPFRLVIEPLSTAPSYCGGSFAVLSWRPRARADALALLAHECAHRWFGHRLATPVVGRGGTWLREGLAEWAGVEVAGALGENADALWRQRFTRYVGRADLRRAQEGVLFANEPTLLDATYLDDPAVPYLRGALVLRLLARDLGPSEFRNRLRKLVERAPERLLTAAEVLEATGGKALAAYYAGTTRLPDLRMEEGTPGQRGFSARIRCSDPLWPGGRVPVRIETRHGVQDIEVPMTGAEGALFWDGEAVVRVELDPERLYLDPVRSNSVFESR